MTKTVSKVDFSGTTYDLESMSLPEIHQLAFDRRCDLARMIVEYDTMNDVGVFPTPAPGKAKALWNAIEYYRKTIREVRLFASIKELEFEHQAKMLKMSNAWEDMAASGKASRKELAQALERYITFYDQAKRLLDDRDDDSYFAVLIQEVEDIWQERWEEFDARRI